MAEIGTIMVGVISAFFLMFVIWVIIFRMTRKDTKNMQDAFYSHNRVPNLSPSQDVSGMGPMPIDGSQRPPSMNPESAFMSMYPPSTPQYSTAPQPLPDSSAGLVQPPPPSVPYPQEAALPQFVNVVSGPPAELPVPTAPPPLDLPPNVPDNTSPPTIVGEPPMQSEHPLTTQYHMATPQFHTLSQGAFGPHSF